MTSQTPPKRGQSHSPPSRQAPPSAENQGNSGKEKNAAYIPPATKEKRQRSVVHYIAILFAAAFLLMLLTYVMDQRQNEATVDSLNQSLTNLQETLSNQNSLQDIYEDNIALIDQVDQLEEQIDQLTKEKDALTYTLMEKHK